MDSIVTMKSQHSNHFRDASFSSYLNGEDEAIIYKLAGSTQTLNPVIAKNMYNDPSYMDQNKINDDEIGVFDAKRYFNEALLDHDDKKVSEIFCDNFAKDDQTKEDQHVSIKPIRPKTDSSTTPSVRSGYYSSCSSQSVLLQSALKNSDKSTKSRFFSSLGCKCFCSDNDSVKIDIKHGEQEKITAKVSKNPIKNEKILNWDSNGVETTSSLNGNKNSDSGSETSSDLFEIETLKGKDHGLSCYAPSEVSIDWSVVTASAADFSVRSDCDELAANSGRKRVGFVATGTKTMMLRRRSTATLGCKSNKSVTVAGGAHQTSKKPFSRVDDEAKITGFRSSRR